MWTQELKRKLDFKCSKLKLLKKKKSCKKTNTKIQYCDKC